MKQLFCVYLSYATYGIIVQNNIIIDAAPIAKWMIGKEFSCIKEWVYNKKNGKIRRIKN